MRYVDTLQLLEQAQATIRVPGLGRDVILELISVRGRTLTDAAAFAMAFGSTPEATPLNNEYLAEVDVLATHLRMSMGEGETPREWARRVSSALCDLASSSLAVLKRLMMLPDRTRTKYDLFAKYLDV